MSSSTRYERRLPELLEELAAPRTPAYFDDILGQVGRTRQRPGWTFPERWLPMSALTQRLATVPRAPMRAALVAVLALIALAVGLALLAGSQRPKVPPPFGPARNGEIVFLDDTGAIRAGSPADSRSTEILPPGDHSLPAFSPDGTRVAFLRTNASGDLELVVVDAQGRNEIVIANADSLLDTQTVTHVGWMPDSRRVVVDGGDGGLYAYDVAAGATRTTVLDRFERNGLQNELANLFRPPAADEILVRGSGPQGEGLYRRRLDGGELTPILTKQTSAVPFSNLGDPQWSPDGSRLVFSIHPPDNEYLGRAYVVNADGTGLRRLSRFEAPGSTVDEAHMTWSPDGTRVAFGRWVNDAEGNVDVRPVTIVDVTTGAEHELPNVEVNGYNGWSWSPDGASILEVPGEGSEDVNEVLVIDAQTGKVTRPGWRSTGAATWQRMLP
jgi:hypothetical protein